MAQQHPTMAATPADISPRRAAGMHQQQPTRTKSFFRQNQNNRARKILLPLLYMSISVLYFYNLFLRDVGSGVHVLRDNHIIDGNVTEATAPIWGAGKESSDPVLVHLEPRSLADVAIANAEVAWKRQVDHQNYLRRRAESREKTLKAWEEAEEAIRLAKMEKENDAIAAEDVSDAVEVQDENVTERLKSMKISNITGELSQEDQEYVRKIGNLRGKHVRGRRKLGQGGEVGFLPILIMISSFTMFRICVSLLIGQTVHLGDDPDFDAEGDDGAETATTGQAGRGGLSSFMTNLSGGPEAVRLRRRARAQRAHRQFQRFVDRLNAEREANGERQISPDTLRHLVNSRDFNGNDYDRLHSFVDENGPAMGSIFSAMGATEAEINRCPSRPLQANDDLLKARPMTGGAQLPTCPVCLESYQVGEIVRTIPCFHTFHKGCIDPWLAQRAECPVCKHSAIG